VSDSRPPADLGQDGKKLYRAVMRDMSAQELVFDAREMVMLRRCAAMCDRIGLLERELDGADLLVPGYMGKGLVGNPLMAELRQTEALLVQTLARLRPPAEDESQGVQVPRSVSARSAANARWGKR
jgi:hypothetical protein